MENFRKEDKVRRLSWKNNVSEDVIRELIGMDNLPVPPNTTTQQKLTCELCGIHCLNEEKLKMHMEYSAEHQRNVEMANKVNEVVVKDDVQPPAGKVNFTATTIMPPPPGPVEVTPTKGTSGRKASLSKTTGVIFKDDLSNKSQTDKLKDLVSGKSPSRASVDYVPPPLPKNYRNVKGIDFSKTNAKALGQTKTTNNEKNENQMDELNKSLSGSLNTSFHGLTKEQSEALAKSCNLDDIQVVELWNTLLTPVENVVETIITPGILTPKVLDFIGSGSKLFRFITADYFIFGNHQVIKIVAYIGQSKNENVLVLDKKSIMKKMTSNKEKTMEKASKKRRENNNMNEELLKGVSEQDNMVDFIGTRLQMNSKGELTLIETSNDALCDPAVKITEYKGISHVYTIKIPENDEHNNINIDYDPSHAVQVADFTKAQEEIHNTLTEVRRKSLEAVHIHEDVVSQMENIQANEAN